MYCIEAWNEMWRGIAMFGTTTPSCYWYCTLSPFNATTSTAAVLSCVLIADSTPNDDIMCCGSTATADQPTSGK